MCCKCCGVTQQKIWVFGLGTLFLVLGIFVVIWWPPFILDFVYKSLPLTPTSRTMAKWEVLPVPVYMHMYLFNWTNPEKVRNSNVKPNFDQLGPYVFREVKVKEDIVWNENNTVTYYGRRTWFFEPEMSGGKLEDNITCPHLPSIAASHVIRNAPKVVKIGFNNRLNHNGGALYQTHTANEWLFEGFFDEFLNYSMGIDMSIANVTIDSNKFAWFLDRNGSKEFEGTYTVHTGVGDLTQMGKLTHWKGSNHTGYYDGECGKVNGSTGDLWEPRRNPHESISMFTPDTCRFINMFPQHEETLLGIRGVRYAATAETFDSGLIYPNMNCFCPPERKGNCPKTGVIDLGPCAQGAPMYMSHSNFMFADPSYAATITGMSPDPKRDSFYIIMEQSLGIPLEVNAAVQVNLYVQRDNDITILSKINNFYAPMFVVSNKAQINEALAREIKFALNLPSLGRNIGIGFLFLGAVMIIIGAVLTVTQNWSGQNKTKDI